MSEPDLLQIKIDQAKEELPEEVRNAIDAVPWKTTILAMRVERGYSFNQLESLEIETELLLCGLIDLEDYPKELEKRMAIPKPQVEELVNEMNEKIFKKIREKLVKNIERKKMNGVVKGTEETEEQSLNNIKTLSDLPHDLESREKLLESIEHPKPVETPFSQSQKREEDTKTPSILTQKFSNISTIPPVTTDHSLMKITKNPEEKTKIPSQDPYRESPQ